MKRICLGSGTLTWARSERISDRYGSVFLIRDGDDSTTTTPSVSLITESVAEQHAGQRGKLIAHITAARPSTHIGDLFRGIFPRPQKVGRNITLGVGTLFTEPLEYGGVQIGLRPDDGRSHDWLSPRALYDAHEQTVSLYFQTED